MPFAGYTDFDDCVRKNQDKDDAKAYCAEIKRAVEGSSDKEVFILGSKAEGDGFVGTIEKYKLGADDKRKGMMIEGVLLAEGLWNKLWYGSKELQRVAHLFTGKQLTIDHSDSVRNVIGEILESKYTERGIEYRAIIFDEQIITLINTGAKFGISAELFASKVNNKELNRIEAKDIEPVRASLVLDAACPPPTCTVNPVENMREIATEILASKCEAQYMDKERRKYKKGFEGCVEAKRACAGLDKDHAEKMCNYIFWRRTGHGYSRITVEEIVALTVQYAELKTEEEREKMIEGLVNEMTLCEKFHEHMDKHFDFDVAHLEILCDHMRDLGILSGAEVKQFTKNDYIGMLKVALMLNGSKEGDEEMEKVRKLTELTDEEKAKLQECPEGEVWDSEKEECVVKPEEKKPEKEQEHECPEGKKWDDEKGECLDSEEPPAEDTAEENKVLKEFTIERIVAQCDDFKAEQLQTWEAEKLVTLYKAVSGKKKESSQSGRTTPTGLGKEKEPKKNGLEYKYF